MKRIVRVLRRAQLDLAEIQRYVATDQPDAANAIVDDLLDAIERLGRIPTMAPVARDPRLSALGYRVLVRGNYAVFYKLVARHVRVYRVQHQRREYGRLL